MPPAPVFPALNMAGRASAAKPDEIDQPETLPRHLSRTYIKVYLPYAIISFGGFALAFVVKALTNAWLGPTHVVHGIFGLAWCIMVLMQAYLGATQKVGNLRNKVHKANGTYAFPVVFVVIMATGVVYVFQGLTTPGTYYGATVSPVDAIHAYILLHMVIFDSLALGLAYAAAKGKNVSLHKDMVGIMILATGDAGIHRVIVMLLHIMMPCDVVSDNKRIVGHVLMRALMVILLVPLFYKYDRLRSKPTVFMLALYVVLEFPVVAMIKPEDGMC